MSVAGCRFRRLVRLLPGMHGNANGRRLMIITMADRRSGGGRAAG